MTRLFQNKTDYQIHVLLVSLFQSACVFPHYHVTKKTRSVSLSSASLFEFITCVSILHKLLLASLLMTESRRDD